MKEDLILDAMKRLGGKNISFVELERELPEIVGHRCLMVDKNCFVWAINVDWVDAFESLHNSGKIIGSGCHVMVYFADGLPLWLAEYKIAKKQRPYKDLRWYPSILNLGA